MAGQEVETEEELFREFLNGKRRECEETAKQLNDTGVYCNTIWDGIMCWPRIRPKQLSIQECPHYFPGLEKDANATKFCTENGTWYVSSETNKTWTNYTACYTSDQTTILVSVSAVNSTLMKDYLPLLKMITHVGYGVSLSSLIIAFTFLLMLKKLHCPRNMLHLHLFMSFIMRAFVNFLKGSLFEQGVGLPSDFVVRNGSTYYVEGYPGINDNWECKALTTVWQYFIMANYSWILMEGLYIHNLIMFALFTDSSSILIYVVLGWGLPLIFITFWVFVRIKSENNLCWTTNQNVRNFLIIRIPITISIVLNFILFVNIVRILLIKIRTSIQEETKKYWRWAKSTLVLVPLFGVHYTLLLGMTYSIGVNDQIELVWLFGDQIFASFQGFFVAILYFFLNSEVQTEISKKWKKLTYHGRVIDHDAQQRSNFQSWSSNYSSNSTCNFFTLCHSFTSRKRPENKSSRKQSENQSDFSLP